MKHPPICDYTGSDYQESFWGTGLREYEDRVEEIALKRLLPKSGSLLLEIGAGAGRNTPRYKGFDRVVLLDYSETQIQKAQSRLGIDKRFTYIVGDAYSLPFVDGLFDTATMIRTLHHLSDVPHAIQEVRRVLQPGGHFILEFASKTHLKAILRFLFGRQSWNPFTMDTVEFAPLHFNFHPKQVRGWLSEHNLAIEQQLTVSYLRLPIFKRFIPLSILVYLDALMQKTGNWIQLSPSIFIGARGLGDTPVAGFDSFFRCPVCQENLMNDKRNEIYCSNCQHFWPIKNGIYYFREIES